MRIQVEALTATSAPRSLIDVKLSFRKRSDSLHTMDLLINVLLIYLLTINVITFIMYGIDKWKAKSNRWRIPEATLLWMAIIGGSVGAELGIKVWHHKTLHKKFKYGVPSILILQCIFVGLLLF